MYSWPNTLPQIPLLDFDSEIVCGLVDPEEIRNPIRLRTYPE